MDLLLLGLVFGVLNVDYYEWILALWLIRRLSQGDIDLDCDPELIVEVL
jgi:hypothetical protein